MARLGAVSGVRLLERESELAAIEHLLGSAADGSGGGLLLRGQAGIGKSALLADARAQAETAGLRVLSARGGVFEGEHAFGVARQLLTPAAEDRRLRTVMLADAGAAAAPVLTGDGGAVIAPDATFSVTYGMHCAIENLASDRPLLVCIDDLQWVDESSLRLLDFVLRRISGSPVAILAALRIGEPFVLEADGALAELEAGGMLGVVEPAVLSESGVLEFTRNAFGPDAEAEFASACHRRTSGNPFFLEQLLRELRDEGVEPTAAAASRVERSMPSAASRIVLARLARRGPDVVAIARAVAVLGDRGRLVDAAEIAGLPGDRAAAAAEALVAIGVFSPGEGLRFVHPLMRDAVTGDIPHEVLGHTHARAAAVLASHGRDAESVAAHVLASPPAADSVAVERLRDAAVVALGRAAPQQAVTLLTRALAEPPPAETRGSVLFELGAAEAAAQRSGAVEHLSAARELATAGAQRAHVTLLLARVLMFAGRSGAIYEMVADAHAELGESDRELALALDAVALSASTMDPEGRRLTNSETEHFAQLAGTTAAERSVLAVLAFDLLRRAEPLTVSTPLVDRAIAGGGCELGPGSDPLAPMMLITTLQWSGQLARAAELAGSVMEQARSAGSALLFTEAIASRAMTRWRLGALGESEADARQTLATEGMLLGTKSPAGRSALVRVMIERSELDAAYAIATEYAPPPGREDRVLNEIWLTTLGRVELAMGRYDDALIHLIQGGEIAMLAGTANPVASEWRILAAQALLGLGRHEDARHMLAPALEAARRTGGPWELGNALRIAGLIESPVSVDLLGEAVSRLESSELTLELARAEVELGAALRRSGRRRDARPPLAAGLELAHQCGASALVERAHTELLAAGARPRRIERSGADSLTPSERRVAALAADGLSNREIAQHLFVSARTVEAQLRSSYAKLGIGSRQDLAAVLASSAKHR